MTSTVLPSGPAERSAYSAGVSAPSRGSWPSSLSAAAAPVALFLVAVAICLVRIDRQPEFDELYHVLAARGWLETGRFVIAEGEYNRTGLFTLLIGWLFKTFGESLPVARAPSVLAYALLVPSVFVWLKAKAGSMAAWIAAVLLLLSPFIVELGTFIRFYALQVLFFFVSVVLLYEAVTGNVGTPRRTVYAIGSVGLMACAVYLQVVTFVGIVGIAAWLALHYGWPWYRAASRRVRLIAALCVLGAGLVLLAGLAEAGVLWKLAERFRAAPEFQQDTLNEFWFYHFWLVIYYPILWTGFPILLVAALARYPRPTQLAACIFITAFVLHSLAGPKDTRYLAYAFPFLFGIFGLGVAAIWPDARAWLTGAMWAALPQPREVRTREWVATGMLGAILAFVILANGATPRFFTMLADIRIPPQPPRTLWQEAAGDLKAWMAKSDVVITNDELDALYYLGTYDVLLHSSRLSELGEKRDFERDFRTGRPVIASPEALQLTRRCFRTGLVILDRSRLASARKGVAEILARDMTPVALRREWSIDAYVWNQTPTAPDRAFCDSIVRRRPPPG